MKKKVLFSIIVVLAVVFNLSQLVSPESEISFVGVENAAVASPEAIITIGCYYPDGGDTATIVCYGTGSCFTDYSTCDWSSDC